MVERGAEGALAAVGLIPVMEMTAGAPQIRAALIDGPVVADHPDLKHPQHFGDDGRNHLG